MNGERVDGHDWAWDKRRKNLRNKYLNKTDTLKMPEFLFSQANWHTSNGTIFIIENNQLKKYCNDRRELGGVVGVEIVFFPKLNWQIIYVF